MLHITSNRYSNNLPYSYFHINEHTIYLMKRYKYIFKINDRISVSMWQWSCYIDCDTDHCNADTVHMVGRSKELINCPANNDYSNNKIVRELSHEQGSLLNQLHFVFYSLLPWRLLAIWIKLYQKTYIPPIC